MSNYKYSYQSNSQKKSTQSAYMYTLNLKGGKKYVGYTSNPEKRINDHFSGMGSKVTQECKPTSIHSINKCSSVQAAKNAERITYHNMKNYHGTDNVRGAGHTSRFSLSAREPYYNDSKPKSNKTSPGCYRCGRTGHYSNNCYAQKHINGYYLD